MKHPLNQDKLFSFLNTQSIVLSDHQRNQFKIYENLLKVWSNKNNLVSKKDVFQLVERHFLPSALLSFCLPKSVNGKIIDIGTGAGFPGLVLKILRPEISLTLLDSSHKKVLFLEEVCEQLALDCQIIGQRCEEYKPQPSEKYLIAISRAVADLDRLWIWSRPLIKTGGSLYAIKGGDFQREIDKLSIENFKVNIITPEEDWLKISDYLNYKYIVKLEK